MVTTRQFARGVVRTMRAMDRAAKQAERQRVASQQILDRQARLDAAARDAAEYEAIIEALTGAHRVEFRRRDWLRAVVPVAEPVRRDEEERTAKTRLTEFRPGWVMRLLRRERKARQSLADEVDKARARDDAAHAKRLVATEARRAESHAARCVVERDPNAMVRALEEHSLLATLPFSVEGVDTMFLNGRVIAVVDGLDLEDMPEEAISLLRSGKVSVKPISAGKRQELHRDAICSAAVRVAMEFLSTLPLDEVEVLMLTDTLDPGSGHIEATPVLHLRVAAQALLTLNLARTSATALVERLGGHMDWSKRDGFRPIPAAALGVDLV